MYWIGMTQEGNRDEGGGVFQGFFPLSLVLFLEDLPSWESTYPPLQLSHRHLLYPPSIRTHSLHFVNSFSLLLLFLFIAFHPFLDESVVRW